MCRPHEFEHHAVVWIRAKPFGEEVDFGLD